MKKTISYIILYIPWLLTFILLPFKKFIFTGGIIYFILISLLFYTYITLFIYNKLKTSNISKNFLLNIVLLYFFNQVFNIFVLYKNNIILSTILASLSLLSICLLKKSYDK